MPNEKNLIPNNKRTPDERRRNASKAGKASGEARRKKRLLKDVVETVLNARPEVTDTALDMLERMGLRDELVDTQLIIALSMAQNAMQGDVKAAAFLRDTAGQSARDTQGAERIKLDRDRLNFERQKAAGEIKKESNEALDRAREILGGVQHGFDSGAAGVPDAGEPPVELQDRGDALGEDIP